MEGLRFWLLCSALKPLSDEIRVCSTAWVFLGVWAIGIFLFPSHHKLYEPVGLAFSVALFIQLVKWLTEPIPD